MKLHKYQTIINKTAVYPYEVKDFGVAYTFLGLVGEYSELIAALTKYSYYKQDKKLLLKEIGDVYWYVAAICNELDIDIEEVITLNPRYIQYSLDEIKDYLIRELAIVTGMAENIKKFYRDNKKIDVSLFCHNLYEMGLLLAELSVKLDSSVEEVLKMNYDKLIKRKKNNTIKGDGDDR